MMYIQIVFALILDWGVWGALPGVWSWVGGTVVVGRYVYLIFGTSFHFSYLDILSILGFLPLSLKFIYFDEIET